jgi:hypothetical protein
MGTRHRLMAICPDEAFAQAERHGVETTTVEAPPLMGTEAYDEWVLDEALEETFPASDPVLPTRPGSSLALRTAKSRDPRS